MIPSAHTNLTLLKAETMSNMTAVKVIHKNTRQLTNDN